MPIIEKIAPMVESLKKVIVMTDAAHMPETALPNVVSYEEWLKEADGDFEWADVGEDAACGMCYTSGTTGDPKGVLYSHRSNVCTGMMAAMPDAMGIGSQRTSSCRSCRCSTPMPGASARPRPMIGAKLVMPGGKMDGESIYELLDTEKVTFTAAVPTVWLMLLQYLERRARAAAFEQGRHRRLGLPARHHREIREDYGVEVIHAWGMTEMSPLGSLCTMKPEYAEQAPATPLLDIKQKQGHAPFGVEMKITDDDDKEMPWDGKTFGRLKVRGPAVASSYYGGDGAEQFDEDGWFDTGDVAHIDENGYMQITDRSKDVIKSGGEWISSIDLENLAVGHPDVAEAAVIGLPHPKWDERPLLVIVAREDKSPSKEDILAFMEGKIAKWWMPDDVAFVDEIPHTATGKIKKTTLRDRFAGYRLPA
jgi:fatty-acyl-CoA synthase